MIYLLLIILFLIVFISIWIEEWDRIISFITRAGLVAFILNMTMIFVGYYVAKFFTSGVAQRKCISLECGLQNGTLAVFVTTQLFFWLPPLLCDWRAAHGRDVWFADQ